MARKKTLEIDILAEGQCEAWYFERIAALINSEERSKYRVRFFPSHETPRRFAKMWKPTNTDHVPVFIDRESNEKGQKAAFENRLKEMAEARSSRRPLRYDLYYSTPSFEVWLLLHRRQTVPPVYSAAALIPLLQESYLLKLQNQKDVKQKANFSKLAEKISLDDVRKAVVRAQRLENNHIEVDKPCSVDGYVYYEQSPATSVHIFVRSLLERCGLWFNLA